MGRTFFFAFRWKTAKRANTRFARTKIGKEYTRLGAGVRDMGSMPTRVRVGMAPDDLESSMIWNIGDVMGVQLEAQAYSRTDEPGMIGVAEGTTPTTPHPPDRRNLPPLSICLPQH